MKHCAVCILLIGIVEGLFFSLAGCFDFHGNKKNKKNQIPNSFDDILCFAKDSSCFISSLFFYSI
ncbi:hypothetical protein AAHE18_06G206300 [Arachis hypogaea]